MSDLVTHNWPLAFKRLNQELNAKGFEIKKRWAYIIQPKGKKHQQEHRLLASWFGEPTECPDNCIPLEPKISAENPSHTTNHRACAPFLCYAGK